MPEDYFFDYPELNQAQSDSKKLLEHCVYDFANRLSILLHGQLKLPPFYFTHAAGEVGVPSSIFKYWKTNTSPLSPRQEPRKLRVILWIFLRVYQRLLPYCPTDTYDITMTRLRDRINDIKDNGVTHNRLAQHLRMSNRTLTDLLNPPTNTSHRPRHCPWEMLQKLEHADTEINTTSYARSAPRRSPKDFLDIQKELLSIPTLQLTPSITINGNCSKCTASWTHLYYDGIDALGNVVYTCRTCGQPNVVRPAEPMGIQLPPQPPLSGRFVERYGPCRACGAPWHNLSREGLDQLGNTVYTCKLCSTRNYVQPKQPTLST